jgi:hypothetical protein
MKSALDHDLADLADDEPVFLLRASDAETPAIARKAAFLYRARHGAEEMAARLEAFADEAFAWQHTEGNAAPPPVSSPDPEPAKATPAKKAAAKKAAPR